MDQLEANEPAARRGFGVMDGIGMSGVRIIGDPLLARDDQGRLYTRIATAFPRLNTIVTIPGVHATQRIAIVDAINLERSQRSEAPLSHGEEENIWMGGVDLVIDDDAVLIRPNPDDMPLAFEADELLQQVVSKKRIRFLHVLNASVRKAIRRRGEYWRINRLPRSTAAMKEMIATSRIGIGGREIYYYDRGGGTRYLTCQEFCGLESLPGEELRNHLSEIARCCIRSNRAGNSEVAFFMVDDDGFAANLARQVASADSEQLKSIYQRLCDAFRAAVSPDFARDDLECPAWRSHMYAALIGQSDKAVSEEQLLGMAAEFFMQVEWLPGGRIEDGELIFDSVFEEEAADVSLSEERRICDERARGFIFNFIRDFGDVEYVNVGRVVGSMSLRKAIAGRRAVYVAEVKQKSLPQPTLRIIRMQKYGVREHLEKNKPLHEAVMEAEEYTEYILNRRLGCRQLGMNLPPRATARKVAERFRNMTLLSPYFERDYVAGVATDKLAPGRFADLAFALVFARLLGRAAAPNLIVGRCDFDTKSVVFDDGDELVIENNLGMPTEIVVADHTGTFVDFTGSLSDRAAEYARCVNDRRQWLPDVKAFSEAFVAGFVERFVQIQQDYRKRRRAFDTLFKHLPVDKGGSFAFRWECVLKRLDQADGRQLAQRIRDAIRFS